jgi:hypothetical protein
MAVSKFSFSKKNFSLGWVFCIYSDTKGAKVIIFILDFAAFKAAQNGYLEFSLRRILNFFRGVFLEKVNDPGGL